MLEGLQHLIPRTASTVAPHRQAVWPSACARKVLPTPTGPTMVTCRRCGGDAVLKHAPEPVQVEHVGRERDRADVGDARRAVAPHETEQRVDASHPRPREWTIEERGGVAQIRASTSVSHG